MKYKTFNSYSNTFVFESDKPGKTIAIFGGIHGNEVSGIIAVKKIIDNLLTGKLKLTSGKLILALGNEEAIKINKRDYKYNLNRLFKEEYFSSNNSDYEIVRVKELSNILKHSDFLLDLHSVSCESIPFVFYEDTEIEKEVVSILGIETAIVGWNKLIGNVLGGDSCSYMNSLGKSSITLESGNHNTLESDLVSYESSLKLLSFFNLISYPFIEKKYINSYEMYSIETTKSGKFSFESNIYNFKEIFSGDKIGIDGSKKVIAKEDFVILLPNYENTKPGDEIFYYGKKFANDTKTINMS